MSEQKKNCAYSRVLVEQVGDRGLEYWSSEHGRAGASHESKCYWSENRAERNLCRMCGQIVGQEKEGVNYIISESSKFPLKGMQEMTWFG